MAPVSLRLGDLRIDGTSRAGEETWFRIRPPGLLFDVGRGAPTLSGARDIFLSHGHLDHALGLPFVLSHRTLHRRSTTRVSCPAAAEEAVRDFIEAAARMEGVSYEYDILPLEPADRVEVGRDLEVEAFATDHVVPSLGYHLLRSRRHLAPELRGLAPEQLVELKKSGRAIEEEESEIWLSYCGDTGPAVFEDNPRLYESTVLLVECTFLNEKLRDRGRRYKHLHFEDLVERAEKFQNDALVLHHLSRRHRADELRAEIEGRLPSLAAKTHLL